MDKKEIIAIVMAALLVLLVLASAHAFGETTEAGNARLFFDDKSLESGTYAAMNFYDMENITSANISVQLNDLQEGNIWAFYQTQEKNGTKNDTQSLMLEIYYLNGMLHVYKYKTLTYIHEKQTMVALSGGDSTVYVYIANMSAHTDNIVGYAHDSDILSINYHLTKEDGTGYANDTEAEGNISISISVENTTYSYNSHTDTDKPIYTCGFATTPAVVNGSYNFSRGMMFGSFDDRNLGKAMFSIDNMTYEANQYGNLTHYKKENWTNYYNHFFKSGESLTDASGAYVIFAVSSPARIYVLDAPLSAPGSPIYISQNVIIDIESWFLTNAWWIISVLFMIILADLILDARDFKEDKGK